MSFKQYLGEPEEVNESKVSDKFSYLVEAIGGMEMNAQPVYDALEEMSTRDQSTLLKNVLAVTDFLDTVDY